MELGSGMLDDLRKNVAAALRDFSRARLPVENRILTRIQRVSSEIAPRISREGGRTEREIAASLDECRRAHTEHAYYADAEPAMDAQWDEMIYPLIKDADFRSVLDLAPGHGRNTLKLKEHAREVHLVDINQSCIDACRARFGDSSGSCRFHYYVNDGRKLNGIADGIISFVYSWDAVVHFDKEVVRDYIFEFARILEPGGTGFIHHSNYGSVDPNSHWSTNPGWRSDMTKELFVAYCKEAGLEVTRQELLPWGKVTDCRSLFRKPTR
jgi:SAM-dependent methyltransferase